MKWNPADLIKIKNGSLHKHLKMGGFLLHYFYDFQKNTW